MSTYCEVTRFPYEPGKPRALIEARVMLGEEKVQVGRAVIVDNRIDELVAGTPSGEDTACSPLIAAALHEFDSVVRSTRQDVLYNVATYERHDIMGPVKAALRPYVTEGTMLIWRDAFRWKCDEGVLPNHYESMSLDSICENFGYEIVHDFNHVAVVRKRERRS